MRRSDARLAARPRTALHGDAVSHARTNDTHEDRPNYRPTVCSQRPHSTCFDLFWLFYATTARCTTNPPQIESLQEIPNSCKAEVHIKSKACNNSTPSQHVKMSHSLLYDSLSNKSTTSRSSGGCDLFEPCDATGQLLTGQEGREHCTCSERHFTLAASDAAIDGLHQQQILIRLTFAQFLFHLGD